MCLKNNFLLCYFGVFLLSIGLIGVAYDGCLDLIECVLGVYKENIKISNDLMDFPKAKTTSCLY